MFNSTKLATMLQLQDAINSKIDAVWVQTKNPFHRAIMVEMVEGVEHHGWKWWKKQEKNLEQLQMELVDAWHFGLSMIIIKFNGDTVAAANSIAESLAAGVTQVHFDEVDYVFSEMSLLEKLDVMVGLAAAKRFDVGLFVSVMADCEMPSDELYRQYVGKNVLNSFRQDHGYKEGTYTKVWDGKEDNEYLVEVMASLDIDSASFADDVYAGMKSVYPG